MNIGTLTATLVVDASQATIGMTAFQRQMLSSVNRINASLATMAASMQGVTAASANMGTIVSSNMNKITVASKTASTGTATFAQKIQAANQASQAAANGIVMANGKIAQSTQAAAGAAQKSPITPVVNTAPAITGLDNLSKTIAASAQRWRTFGYLASATVTLPLVMLGKAAITAASEFEFSMQKIVGLVGMSQQTINQWSDDLLEMGPKVAKSPRELANALYFVTSAGYKSAEALTITETAAKAATAGLGDSADVAKFLVFSMNAYKDTNLTAARSADILVAAVREGAIEADGFTSAMQQVLPIASALGVPLDQVAGSMAAMSLQGASAANSAVYLKGMLNSLLKIKPGSGAEKALNKLGESGESMLRLLKEKGLMATLLRLQELSNQSTGNIFLKEIFRDIRGMTGALSLTGGNLENNLKVLDAVKNSYGGLAKATDAVAESTKVRLDSAMSSLGASMIKLGDVLKEVIVPMLEKWAERIKNLVEWFSNLNDFWQNLITNTLLWAAALGPLTLLVSLLKYGVVALLSVFKKLSTAFTFLTLLTKGLTGSFGALRAAMIMNPTLVRALWSIGAAMGPVGLAVAGAAAATTLAIVGIKKYKEHISEAAKASMLFNKSLVDVNGSMVKLNSLTETDYGAMDKKALLNAKLKAFTAYSEANKQRLASMGYAGITEEELASGAKIKGKHAPMINAAMDAMIAAKAVMKNIDVELRRREDEIISQTLLDRANQMADGVKKVNGVLGDGDDALQDWEKAAIKTREALDKLNESSKEAIAEMSRLDNNRIKGGTPTDYQHLFLRTGVTGGGAQANGESEFMQDVTKDLAQMAFMNAKFGDTLDSAAAQMDMYKKKAGDLWNSDLYKAGNEAALIAMDELIAKHNSLKVAYADEFMGKFESELDLITAKNKVLGESYNNTRDKLALFKSTMDKMWDDPNLRERTDLIKIMTDRIKELTRQQYAVDILTSAFENFFMISGEGFKNFDQFIKDWANGVLRSIQSLIAQIAAKKLAEFLVNLFVGKDKAQEKSNESNKALAMTNVAVGASEIGKAAAMKVATAALNAETIAAAELAYAGATASAAAIPFPANLIAIAASLAAVTGALASGKALAQGMGADIPKMAEGGIVPSGYPNDTFPAMLSSAEAVIPLSKLNLQPKGTDEGGVVVFEIEGDKLVGILKKQTKKHSIY